MTSKLPPDPRPRASFSEGKGPVHGCNQGHGRSRGRHSYRPSSLDSFGCHVPLCARASIRSQCAVLRARVLSRAVRFVQSHHPSLRPLVGPSTPLGPPLLAASVPPRTPGPQQDAGDRPREKATREHWEVQRWLPLAVACPFAVACPSIPHPAASRCHAHGSTHQDVPSRPARQARRRTFRNYAAQSHFPPPCNLDNRHTHTPYPLIRTRTTHTHAMGCTR